MPLPGKYLLDTNIIIALFANDNAVINNLSKAKEIYIPSIALGELYFGAYKSKKLDNNLSVIDNFAINNNILVCNKNTAKFYGIIKSNLLEQGHPIPENDIWISAVAFQNDITLITRDEHFKYIENLNLEVW
jgi:tRNA(fMet)-specific endonuclease VapC